MDTPGYDPVSATGQVAGGCNIVVFTTGRGSASASSRRPRIKIATNHRVYARMEGDMDINCGDILDGASIVEQGRGDLREDPARRVGRATKSELLGLATTSSSPGRSGRRCRTSPSPQLFQLGRGSG